MKKSTQIEKDAAASADAASSPPMPGMNVGEDHVGLRERKRRATRSAIENAALDLLEQGGYESVTIEGICREADISTRTFFNYFSSKDAAIVGEGPGGLSAEQVTAMLEEYAPDLLGALVAALVSGEKACKSDCVVERRRHKLLAADPRLAWQHVRLGMDFGHLLRTAVTEYLETHPAARLLDSGVPLASEAELVLSLAFLTVRQTFSFCEDRTQAAPTDLAGAFARMRTILDASVPPERH